MKYGDRDEGIWDDLSYDYNDLLQIELDMTKEEMLDMEAFIKQDMDNKELKDEDIFRISEKIKNLEKQILNVIEG